MRGYCRVCSVHYRWRWLHRQTIAHGLNRDTYLAAKGYDGP